MRDPEKRQFEPQALKEEEGLLKEQPVAREEIESEKDLEQESLRNRINRVSGIFRAFRFIDNEIKRHRLDPLLKLDYSDEYIKGLVPTRYPEDQKLTKKDLHETENKVLALTLEIADQILQHKPARKNARENPKLLEQLCLILKKAELLSMNMQKQKPQEAQDLFKKILVERKGIPEENIGPEQIKQLADSIGDAHNFIYIEEKVLKKHSGK